MSRSVRRKARIAAVGAWLRSALGDNLGLKLVCLVFALSLVGYQRSLEDKRTRTVALQLDVQLPPESHHRELMTTLPPNIKLTVEGSTRDLDRLVSETSSWALDLRDGRKEQVLFEPSQFEVPPGVKIKFIEPVRLALDWQDIITRGVPVQSSVMGSVADGYEVSSLAVDPAEVQLRGAAKLVQVTQFVRVAPFDVTGLSEGNYRRLLALDPPPDRTTYVGTSNVAVSVEIRRRLISQVFSQVPVEVVGVRGARVTPPTVLVTVVGPPEVVRGVPRELVLPQVSVSEEELKQHGSKMAEVRVELSRATAEVQPPSVKVSW